jgi:taurine transport system ATP-binding protein
MSLLEFIEVGLSYHSGKKVIPALERINLKVNEGEFVAVVGASGCGKSSLLKLASGVIAPTAGRVLFRGEPVAGLHTSRVMMFQDPLLYPWMSVEENVGFALKLSKVHKEERQAKVQRYLSLTGLTEFASSPPYELSGGMKQRTAFARTLACDPDIVLMDEPFAALDALTRRNMQRFLYDLWRESGKTFLLVTHDIDEAIRLARRIVVMSPRPGKIICDLTVRDTDQESLKEAIYSLLS